MAKVAFLGLGVMGYPMARHLRSKGGHDVTVYNRSAAKADQWVAQFGGKKAATPKAETWTERVTAETLFKRSSRGDRYEVAKDTTPGEQLYRRVPWGKSFRYEAITPSLTKYL